MFGRDAGEVQAAPERPPAAGEQLGGPGPPCPLSAQTRIPNASARSGVLRVERDQTVLNPCGVASVGRPANVQ
jgi:hypothetical protein